MKSFEDVQDESGTDIRANADLVVQLSIVETLKWFADIKVFFTIDFTYFTEKNNNLDTASQITFGWNLRVHDPTPSLYNYIMKYHQKNPQWVIPKQKLA